ncbi:amino acid ABC transporter permease [Corynebacterium sp. sy017]|uniref:amino acid ABC transporter permease n=1 Tax=unclassified Corynebacterium TaxID=2624378 RepID=UPI001186F21F|nr:MULTISPECIES: amino acid ABC transporter permease [unclassified Corynebacterium]MBP3087797.1 amino acid ABC transporter permease [Corynebacterium sp. sy017]TSD92344.1 amino acid ABC transporter permease [Corynebacterium sp. SY003]
MSASATILYDAPGPLTRKRNRVYTAITTIIFVALLAWIGFALWDNGQLDSEKWLPFTQNTTWETYLLPGLIGTLKSAFLSILFAVLLGIVLGLGRLAQSRIVRVLCAVIVEFFRAIPVLLLIIFSYQVLALYKIVPPKELAFTAVVFGLTMYNGSVIAEILRSGIETLPRGQTEAALALGLSYPFTLSRVLLPQAVIAMLPALISQAVIALKDSALGYQIGYIEIVRQGIQSSAVNKNYLASLIIVAIIMILINYALSFLARSIEQKLRTRRKSSIAAK